MSDEERKDENVQSEEPGDANKDNANNGGQNGGDYDQKRKIACAVAYIFGILFFVPLIVCPRDEFAKFHANQSLAILLVVIVGETVLGILAGIKGIEVIFSIIIALFNLAILLLCIFAIIGVINGEKKELPLLGKIKLIQ